MLQNSGIGNNDGDHADDDDEDEDEEDEDDQHTPRRDMAKRIITRAGNNVPVSLIITANSRYSSRVFPLTGAKLPATKKERRELFNIYNSLL